MAARRRHGKARMEDEPPVRAPLRIVEWLQISVTKCPICRYLSGKVSDIGRIEGRFVVKRTGCGGKKGVFGGFGTAREWGRKRVKSAGEQRRKDNAEKGGRPVFCCSINTFWGVR